MTVVRYTQSVRSLVPTTVCDSWSTGVQLWSYVGEWDNTKSVSGSTVWRAGDQMGSDDAITTQLGLILLLLPPPSFRTELCWHSRP